MKRLVIACLALLWSATAWAAGVRTLKGQVSCEGRGLSGVVVTDGESFTQTDPKGRYELSSADDNCLIYITIPSGYRVESKASVPQFWQKITDEKASYDFELIRKEQDDTHHGFIVTADPQIWHKKEFPALKSAMEDIRETVSGYEIPFHGICCGDVISYDHTFYPTYNEVTAMAGIDFFSAPGNHDMTLYSRSHETSVRLWEETFGPVCYSFNVGRVHYVILNDNFYIGREYFYIGYLDERQLAWLERDLSYVEEGSTVMVAMHIPSTCEEKDRQQFEYRNIAGVMTNAHHLHRMLAPYNAHILSGHTHTTYNQPITDRLYEHVIPALSGAWWQGPLCTDGTPRGYGVFEIDGDKVSWYYKSTDYDADHQMVLYGGEKCPQYKGLVVANIWASDPTWRVEAMFDGGAALKMERFESYDPTAQEMYRSTEGFDHSYIYPSPADHFYRIAIPEGAKRVTVEAEDRFGNVYRESLEIN